MKRFLLNVMVTLLALYGIYLSYSKHIFAPTYEYRELIGRKDCAVSEVIAHFYGIEYTHMPSYSISETNGPRDPCWDDNRAFYKKHCHLPLEGAAEIMRKEYEKQGKTFIAGTPECPVRITGMGPNY